MIEGKTVNLRTVREEDLETMFAATSRYENIGEYWPVQLPTMTKMKERYAKDGWWTTETGMLIVETKDKRVVGGLGFFKTSEYAEGVEIGGSIFEPKDRGQGYMSEALALLSAFIFEMKPIPRIQACCIKGNKASRRIIEKCGFQFEGCQRDACFSHGEYHDLECFSLLRRECPTVKEVIEKL